MGAVRARVEGTRARLGVPEAAVALSVLIGLWALSPETTLSWRANDSSIHAALVRWVTERLSVGHLPLDGWFPYLSLGAARFHHYQSLPHILTGTVGLAIGADRAFAWSLYLLLATWPMSVYLGGRLLGLGRVVAGAAGAIAPLVASTQPMGIQWSSYVWRGYGAWAQLWGLWLLPIVIGLTWQAVAHRRWRGMAATGLALIIPTHLVMAYIASLLVPIWALTGSDRWRRVLRGATIGIAALAASAWFLVPLALEREWVTRNATAARIAYESIGVSGVTRLFLDGTTLDGRRIPILTCLTLGGLAIAVTRARREESMRALLAATAIGAILYSGRASFGWLGVLPGMDEIFMTRFIVALQIPCLYLAGVGVAGVLSWAMGATEGRLRLASGTLAVCAVAVALQPAIMQRLDYARVERALVIQQERSEETDRPALRDLLDIAEVKGPGRVYSSMNRLGRDIFTLGITPFYMAFLGEDADAIGFTRPTWSILSDIESGFDETDARQYPVFGIRYVILARGLAPEVPATRVATRTCCVLWQIDDSGYFRFAQSARTVPADRSSLFAVSQDWFDSEDFDRGAVWTLDYSGAEAPEPLRPVEDAVTADTLGQVTAQELELADGVAEATVEVDTESLLVLSATFDPGWTATVDGVETSVQMVSPGVVAVPVEPGTHEVRFVWKSFPSYGWLLLGLLAPVLLARRRWRVFEDPTMEREPQESGGRIL